VSQQSAHKPKVAAVVVDLGSKIIKGVDFIGSHGRIVE